MWMSKSSSGWIQFSDWVNLLQAGFSLVDPCLLGHSASGGGGIPQQQVRRTGSGRQQQPSGQRQFRGSGAVQRYETHSLVYTQYRFMFISTNHFWPGHCHKIKVTALCYQGFPPQVLFKCKSLVDNFIGGPMNLWRGGKSGWLFYVRVNLTNYGRTVATSCKS